MEFWHKGRPYTWLGTQTQEGNIESWINGTPGNYYFPFSATTLRPLALKKADGVLRDDFYAVDGIESTNIRTVVGVANN